MMRSSTTQSLQKVEEGVAKFNHLVHLASVGTVRGVNAKTYHTWGATRQIVAKVIMSSVFAAFMTIVLCLNMMVVLVEANANAKCMDDPESCDSDFTMQVIDRVCTACYVVEVLLRIYVYRRLFCKCPWNILDASLVTVSLVGEIFRHVLQNAVLLRLLRALRVMRVLRLLSMFQELYLLMLSLASTMKTIFWSCVMLSFVMSVFAVLALEVLRPIHKEILAERAANGTLEDCKRCITAFDSVGQCIVTLFFTLVLGDGVSDMLVPMLERDWKAAVVILAFIAIVYLGFSNLILSVIVDKANEARCQDITYQAMNNLKIKSQARQELKALWEEVNDSGRADISLEELKKLWVESATFHDYFKSMDIDMSFLEYALTIMDKSGDGQVSFEEFAESVVKLKNTDSGPLITYVKYQVSQVMHEVVGLKDQISNFQQDMLKMANTASTEKPTAVIEKPVPEETNGSVSHWRRMQQVFDAAGLVRSATSIMEEDPNKRDLSADDLIELLKSAYEDPLPINLPNLSGPQRVFAEHCQRVEIQLERLSIPLEKEVAQLELYCCSARLLAAVSRALPKMLPKLPTSATARAAPSVANAVIHHSSATPLSACFREWVIEGVSALYDGRILCQNKPAGSLQ